MKHFLPLTLIATAVLGLSSCVKTVEAPPPVVDPLVGSWYLDNASELHGNTWYSFDAGIYGVLSFYGNGNAQYDDGNTLMQGNWYTNYISDGYYDEYGNYYTNLHQNFQASMSSGHDNSLNLYFDDINFAGSNQFTATYYTGKTVQLYTFKRY